MKIEIKITKEVLRRSMWCGTKKCPWVSSNCAVAVAVRDFLPYAQVVGRYMRDRVGGEEIPLSEDVFQYIKRFDSLKSTPESRLSLPEFSFEIDVPDEVIERIGIQQAKEILERSETLNLIES